jgi:hypothetical protein
MSTTHTQSTTTTSLRRIQLTHTVNKLVSDWIIIYKNTGECYESDGRRREVGTEERKDREGGREGRKEPERREKGSRDRGREGARDAGTEYRGSKERRTKERKKRFGGVCVCVCV